MQWKHAAGNAILPGLYAGLTVLAAAALHARAQRLPPAAPVNVMSHIIWGDREATRTRHGDLKHTGVGAALGLLSAYLWAIVFERYVGEAAEKGRYGKTVLGGGVIAAVAYWVDYRLLPRRFTPGWELVLPRSFLPVPYLLMALRLPARALPGLRGVHRPPRHEAGQR